MRQRAIRRSLLYVPGHSEKMIDKALNLNADSIILDLEDAVSPNEKTAARMLVKESIQKFKEKKKEIIIRINDVKTKDGVLDIEAIVEEKPNAIIVPKADEEAIQVTDILLNATEMRYNVSKKSIEIIPLLETSYSIVHTYKILDSSHRITAVQFGAEDLTKEIGIDRTDKGMEITYARSGIVHAAVAREIDILDTPFTNIDDNDGLIYDTKNAKQIGFTGKTCIHPNQIETVNAVFTPDAKEVKKARELIKVFDEAVNNGSGVCTFEGKMIDNPIAERARKLVEKADLISKHNS